MAACLRAIPGREASRPAAALPCRGRRLRFSRCAWISLPLLHLPAVPSVVVGPASLAAVMLYVVCFAMGAGPIPWVYLTEILPEQIKGSAQVRGAGGARGGGTGALSCPLSSA